MENLNVSSWNVMLTQFLGCNWERKRGVEIENWSGYIIIVAIIETFKVDIVCFNLPNYLHWNWMLWTRSVHWCIGWRAEIFAHPSPSNFYFSILEQKPSDKLSVSVYDKCQDVLILHVFMCNLCNFNYFFSLLNLCIVHWNWCGSHMGNTCCVSWRV